MSIQLDPPNGATVVSDPLAGRVWGDLSVRGEYISSPSVAVTITAYFGTSETSSHYFDDLQLNALGYVF